MRKVMLISASVASIVIGGCILGVVAMANYKPVRQHVEYEITPKPACDGHPCKAVE